MSDEKTETEEGPDYGSMTLGELKTAHEEATTARDAAQAAYDETDDDGKTVGKTAANAAALRDAIASRNEIAEAHNTLLSAQAELGETEDKDLAEEAKADESEEEKAEEVEEAKADDDAKGDVDKAAEEIANVDPAAGDGSEKTEEEAKDEDAPALVTASLRVGTEIEAGQQLETLNDLGGVLHAGMIRPSDGRQSAFTVELFDDEAVKLDASNTAFKNGEILGMYAEGGSLAKATFCALTEIDTNVPSCVRGGRPVADFLSDAPMTRGQVRVPTAVGISNIAADWTYCESAPGLGDDDQAGVLVTDEATWKQCSTVDCPTFEDFCLESVYWCLEVPKDIDMSAPEHVAQFVSGAAAGADRRGDQKLLQEMVDRSIANGRSYSYGAHISAIPDLYRALVEVLQTIAMDGRLELGGFDAIIPQGLAEWAGIDSWNRSEIGDQSVSDAFAAAGIGTVVETPDWPLAGVNPFPDFGVPAATTAIPFPIVSRVFDIVLVNRSEARRGTGRNIEVGLTSDFRDFGQYRRNSRGIFVEYDETMVYQGCDPVAHLQLTLCPNGGRVGLFDPTTICL